MNKKLFLILLALYTIFFLAGCDGGGGGSSSSGGDDWDGTATSTALNGAANTDFSLTVSGTGNTGAYTISLAGTGVVSSGVITNITFTDGHPQTIKYKETKTWNGASLVDVASPVVKTINITGPTFDMENTDGTQVITFSAE